jgi:integrase
MGTVFKKTFTKPLPAGAETITRKGERLARWKDRRGKTRKAPVTVGKDGTARIILESPFYVAKYRDGAGVVHVEPTGCRDETAARQVLADLERRAELVRSGMVTVDEERIAKHLTVPLDEHFEAFDQHLQAQGASSIHRSYTGRYLRRVTAECSFGTLADLRPDTLERWLAERSGEGMGAKTRNLYRGAIVAFCNWCVRARRIAKNPFVSVPVANAKADRRRERRAMTGDELSRLLAVARERPLLEALTVRKGPRAGERYANVRPEVRERLELLGWERALIYKTFLLTGLRKAELASLTVGQLFLDNPVAFALLDAADEKNREGSEIAIRHDLAADLKQWLTQKLASLQSAAIRDGGPIPSRLPADTPLFNVPTGLLRIMNRDLRLAGIPKRDDRGRVLDVHALRTTFGTLLSKGGVAPRTAQAAMRHSDIRLTMNTYTDPALLDVRGALDALPDLPLRGEPSEIREALRATGTDNSFPPTLAPLLAPTPDFSSNSQSIPDKTTTEGEECRERPSIIANADSVSRRDRLTRADKEGLGVGATGFEPATSRSRSVGTESTKLLESLWLTRLYGLERQFASTSKLH